MDWPRRAWALDLGCGLGHDALFLASQPDTVFSRVVCADFSDAALKRAEALARENREQSRRLHFVQADFSVRGALTAALAGAEETTREAAREAGASPGGGLDGRAGAVAAGGGDERVGAGRPQPAARFALVWVRSVLRLFFEAACDETSSACSLSCSSLIFR